MRSFPRLGPGPHLRKSNRTGLRSRKKGYQKGFLTPSARLYGVAIFIPCSRIYGIDRQVARRSRLLITTRDAKRCLSFFGSLMEPQKKRGLILVCTEAEFWAETDESDLQTITKYNPTHKGSGLALGRNMWPPATSLSLGAQRVVCARTTCKSRNVGAK
jgi:hypothetical protein